MLKHREVFPRKTIRVTIRAVDILHVGLSPDLEAVLPVVPRLAEAPSSFNTYRIWRNNLAIFQRSHSSRM